MKTTSKLTVMTTYHVDEVVDIHLKAFHGFMLSYLGKRFLKEFYTGVIDDPTGIAYVIEDRQYLFGFVVGSAQPNGLYHRLLKQRWWRFGIAAIPAMISAPKILPRLFRAFTISQEKLPHPNCATLMSIAVNPTLQGHGAGTALINTFLEEAVARGLDAVNLKTDAKDNDNVNHFYIKMGFELFRTFSTPEGRLMNEYVYYLDNYQS